MSTKFVLQTYKLTDIIWRWGWYCMKKKQERIHSTGPTVHSTVTPTLQTVLSVLSVLTVLKVLTVLNVLTVWTVLNVLTVLHIQTVLY